MRYNMKRTAALLGITAALTAAAAYTVTDLLIREAMDRSEPKLMHRAK